MSNAILEVFGLTGGYGPVTVLHAVKFTADAGSLTALVGSNGAGKSTTLRMVSGLTPSRAGCIRFDGEDITGLRTDQRVNRGIVMVPEGRQIFPQLSVMDNLRIGAFAPRARPTAAKTTERVFQLFPRLAERRRQFAGTLSGGEQQMLALGRGLMAAPKLLLLDEPTLGLAPLMADFIFEAIRHLRSEGIALLLAEQDVLRTLQLAQRAYVLENGHIVTAGVGRELVGDARIKQAYLGL